MKTYFHPTFVDPEDNRRFALHTSQAQSLVRRALHASMLFFALLLGGLLYGVPVHAQWAEPVYTYNTGLGENGAEIISVRGRYGVLTNAVDGSVDVLDLTNLSNINRIRRIKTPELIGLTSVAIHPERDYFIAVAGSSKPSTAPAPGLASVFRLSDGTLLTTFATGIQPDSVAISPDGEYAVIANEAESPAEGDNGGNGSLTVVFLGYFRPNWPSALHPIQLALPSLAGGAGLSNGRTDDIGRLPIDNTPGTLEPEFVTFAPGGRFAYITLQENNAILRLRLWNLQLSYVGAGTTTHEVDIVDNSQYAPTATLTLLREPDGIDAVNIDYHPYFVTADEGDTRNSTGSSGPRGGRTVTIFDANSGRVVADTGSQLDALAAAKGFYPDSRSNRGGSEPEGIDTFNTGQRVIAAVTLERAHAVAFIDISNPHAPHVFDMVRVGLNPEGIKLIRRTNTLYALTANEVSGTLSVVRVNGLAGYDVASAGVDQAATDSDDDEGVVTEAVEVSEDSTWGALETGFRNSMYLPVVVR